MKERRLSHRKIIPGDKTKGRGNPKISILVDEREMKETTTDIKIHKNGTFIVKESAIE